MKELTAQQKPRGLEEKIGIDPSKYSKDKTINDLSEFLELATSFTSTLLVFLISSLLIFLSVSVGYAVVNKTYLFPILFFIAAIPVIAGVSLIGFSKGLTDTIRGVNGILNYGVNLIDEIYSLSQKNNNGNVTISEVGRFVGYYIVAPAVKIWADTKFLGGFVYKLTSKGFSSIYNLLDKQENSTEKKDNNNLKIEKIKSMLAGTNTISGTLIEGVRSVSLVLSIAGIILGVILIVIVVVATGVL